PRPELYDRAADPNDRTDLAARKPSVAAEIRRQLAATAAAMGDDAEPHPSQDDSAEERERREQLASLGYLTGAGSTAPSAARLDPKDGLPGFLAVQKAEEWITAGKPREAAALIEPFTKKDRTNPRLWHTLGKALAGAGDLAGAER